MPSTKVTIIVPTVKRRAGFLALCRESIAAQDYPKSLITVIVDDDEEANTGKKRNRMCAQAADYSIIIPFDDDDFSPPGRVSTQVACLEANPNMLLCGTRHLYVYDLLGGYGVVAKLGMVKCGSVAFCKKAWTDFPYDEKKQPGACCAFTSHYRSQTFDMWNLNMLIMFKHGDNATRGKGPLTGLRRSESTVAMQRMVGVDRLKRYEAAAKALQSVA
jgi:glycosyltransferase involved in cell wall biosynthesis